MKGEDDVKLEEEYKLLKKSTLKKSGKIGKKPVSNDNKRKRKRETSNSKEKNNSGSSDSSENEQGKRVRKIPPGMISQLFRFNFV